MSAPTLIVEEIGGYSDLKQRESKLEDGYLERGEDENEDEELLVPDGGWGWAVCAASFMVNFILDGTMFSFGILLIELLDDLQESKAVTSWVGSALLGMSMFMGPVVSLMLKRYSCRQVTIAGTLLSAAGFIASVFSPNIYVLIVTYGVVGGAGFSMIFMPSIIVVGLYFSKRRAIATGIATSGSGLGTFAYAYLCDRLLQVFTWRQTILILAGILLNCLACALVFRPLIPVRRRRGGGGGKSRRSFSCSKGGRGGEGGGGSSNSTSSDSSTYCESEEEERAAMIVSTAKRGGGGGGGLLRRVVDLKSDSPAWMLHQSAQGLADIGRQNNTDGVNVPSSSSSSSASSSSSYSSNAPLSRRAGLHSPGHQLGNSRHQHHRRHHQRRTDALLQALHGHAVKAAAATAVGGGGGKATSPDITITAPFLPPAVVMDERLHRSLGNIGAKDLISVSSVPPVDDKLFFLSETELHADTPAPPTASEVEARGHIAMGLIRPILRKDIYYSGSVSHLPEFRTYGGSMSSFLAHMTQPGSGSESDDSGSSMSSDGGSKRRGGGGGGRGACHVLRRKCANVMRKLIDVDMFKNSGFLCLLVTFTMWTVHSVPLTYLPDMAVSKGIARQQAAFLISIVGITNTIGRVLAGFITDAARMRCIWLYSGALFLAAAMNFVMPWCDAFPLLASASAVFGLCMAVAVSMRTIILAQQLGIEVLTKSFGMVALFQGVFFMVNPPIAGGLFDLTGAYVGPFTLAGVMYLLSALSALAVGVWFKPAPPLPDLTLHVPRSASQPTVTPSRPPSVSPSRPSATSSREC